MIYQYIAPHPSLREFVRDFLIADFEFDKNKPVPSKAFSPRPELAITFLPKSNLTRVNVKTGNMQKAPTTSICGQQVSRYNFNIGHKYQMIRVNFHPGALYRLLNIPITEFTDSWFNSELLVNREMNIVNEQLAECSDYPSMIRIVEEYLGKKISTTKVETNVIDKVATYILKDPVKHSMDWLAREACLCPRQFHRKFKERMGVGPKLFSRIVRFFHAYKYKQAHLDEDWLSVAIQFGYSDYQHMVKDFQEFANVTPNVWIKEDNHSPERILQLQ